MADENYSYAPKYVQIQNYILQKIESGEYAAGDKIPSEIELARQFDVSRLTVNTAVKELAHSGLFPVCPWPVLFQPHGIFRRHQDRTL